LAATRSVVRPRRPTTERPVQTRSVDLSHVKIVGLVASTGGPQTVQLILGELPETFPVPIALVQHTALGFTPALVSWLDSNVALRVLKAVDGMVAQSGQVIVAPDDRHLAIESGGLV